MSTVRSMILTIDAVLRRTPEDIDALRQRAVEAESHPGGLFGTHWDGGGYSDRAEARRAFGEHWRKRREAAEWRTRRAA